MFALVGQAMAFSTMACDMNNHQASAVKENMQVGQVASNVHQHHTKMQIPNANDETAHQVCCADECKCPVTSCSSIVLLDSIKAKADQSYVAELILNSSHPIINRLPSSLFRPPIIA